MSRFYPSDHPRDSGSGRFAEKSNSDSDTSLVEVIKCDGNDIDVYPSDTIYVLARLHSAGFPARTEDVGGGQYTIYTPITEHPDGPVAHLGISAYDAGPWESGDMGVAVMAHPTDDEGLLWTGEFDLDCPHCAAVQRTVDSINDTIPHIQDAEDAADWMVAAAKRCARAVHETPHPPTPCRMSTFDEAKHRRGGDPRNPGRFSEHGCADGGVALDDASPLDGHRAGLKRFGLTLTGATFDESSGKAALTARVDSTGRPCLIAHRIFDGGAFSETEVAAFDHAGRRVSLSTVGRRPDDSDDDWHEELRQKLGAALTDSHRATSAVASSAAAWMVTGDEPTKWRTGLLEYGIEPDDLYGVSPDFSRITYTFPDGQAWEIHSDAEGFTWINEVEGNMDTADELSAESLRERGLANAHEGTVWLIHEFEHQVREQYVGALQSAVYSLR
jgi:hypothetical protein